MGARVAAIAMLVVATGCAAAATTTMPAQAATGVRIPVVRCPTSFGVKHRRTPVRRTLTLRAVPDSTARLTAYTNTRDYLIGPSKLRCAGAVGADGNSMIQAWPSGQARPASHSAGAGLALSVIPTCVGCKAWATCHYFPTFRRDTPQRGLICRPEPPPGEQLRYLAKRLVAFVDPPFVKGAGRPSGGGQQSSGLIGIQPGPQQVVFTSSCTLAAAERSACVDSADATRSLYSRPR